MDRTPEDLLAKYLDPTETTHNTTFTSSERWDRIDGSAQKVLCRAERALGVPVHRIILHPDALAAYREEAGRPGRLAPMPLDLPTECVEARSDMPRGAVILLASGFSAGQARRYALFNVLAPQRVPARSMAILDGRPRRPTTACSPGCAARQAASEGYVAAHSHGCSNRNDEDTAWVVSLWQRRGVTP